MKKILIADDDPDVRHFLSDILQDEGYLATTTKDGADAVLALTDGGYSLAILDMLMPGLDGLQAARLLRKILPDLPILGLTGYIGRGYMAQATDLGISTLSKPVQVGELLKEVRELIG